MSIKFDVEFAKLMRNRRDILTELIFIFKLIDIQIAISRQVINDVSDDSYENSKRFMKFLIKEFQTKNQWMKKIHIRKFASSRRLCKRFQKWIIRDKNFNKCNECFYVLDNAVVRRKFIKKYHDDSLSEYFEAQKILDSNQRKYFWYVCAKQMRTYIQTCNICQRIKVFYYKFYEKLNSLSVLEISWKNFLWTLLSTCHRVSAKMLYTTQFSWLLINAQKWLNICQWSLRSTPQNSRNCFSRKLFYALIG